MEGTVMCTAVHPHVLFISCIACNYTGIREKHRLMSGELCMRCVSGSAQQEICSLSLSPGKGTQWNPDTQRHSEAQRKRRKKRQAPIAGRKNEGSDKTSEWRNVNEARRKGKTAENCPNKKPIYIHGICINRNAGPETHCQFKLFNYWCKRHTYKCYSQAAGAYSVILHKKAFPPASVDTNPSRTVRFRTGS